MPTSALVLTLDARPERAANALAGLRERTDLELGERQGNRLPVVLTTDELWQSEAAVNTLMALPGVQFVDVVAVDFSDLPEPTSLAQQEPSWNAATS